MKVLLLVPAAALVALGGDGLYNALRGRERITIDCADFVRARPSSHRVLVTGCEIDYAAAGYVRAADGGLQELLLPARPSRHTSPAPIVIATRDPSALAMARPAADAAAGVPQSIASMEKAAAAAGVSGAIDGLVRTGVIERIKTHRVLSGLPVTAVAPDAVVIDLHGRAAAGLPLVAFAAGVLLAVAALLPSRAQRGASRRAEQPAPRTDAAGAPGAAGHHALLSGVALPRLLLLDLAMTAGPDAIETAPPLGSRRHVTALLTGVIPDVHLDTAGRVLSRADGSIAIDLGAHDPVATAIVDARGEAGVALVKEILLTTGWRAFAPKTGLFVTIDELASIGALATDDRRRDGDALRT